MLLKRCTNITISIYQGQRKRSCEGERRGFTRFFLKKREIKWTGVIIKRKIKCDFVTEHFFFVFWIPSSALCNITVSFRASNNKYKNIDNCQLRFCFKIQVMKIPFVTENPVTLHVTPSVKTFMLNENFFSS